MADFTISEYITSRSGYDPTASDMVILIEHAKKEVGMFSDKIEIYNKAIALLVMHWKTLDLKIQTGELATSIVGVIESEKEGDLSRSYKLYGATGKLDPFLSQTIYGLEFLSLGNKFIFKPRNRFIG